MKEKKQAYTVTGISNSIDRCTNGPGSLGI